MNWTLERASAVSAKDVPQTAAPGSVNSCSIKKWKTSYKLNERTPRSYMFGQHISRLAPLVK